MKLSSKVNCKLTDFGSSRNMNLLMTNMTFTKGVGTPKYMAPEVLRKEHYKRQADIYAFAITMYETFTWTEAYPKKDFKFPWKIAEFVTDGKRLPLNDIDEQLARVIESTWKDDPKERMSISDIIVLLDTELLK